MVIENKYHIETTQRSIQENNIKPENFDNWTETNTEKNKTNQGGDTVKDNTIKPVRKMATVQKLDPITSHIRMEEMHWQKILERRKTRENHERVLMQAYKDEMDTYIRNIEKQKKAEQQVLMKRLADIDKKRHMNNNAFNRIQKRKERNHRIENEALKQRIDEIEKRKQKNVEKLKERVSNLDERKHREHDLFVKRMQTLERRREEDFEASHKRFLETEKRKFNERKAWLLRVQRIEGSKKEVFTKNEQSFPLKEDDDMSQHCGTTFQTQSNMGNVKDSARHVQNKQEKASPRHKMLTKIRVRSKGRSSIKNITCTGVEVVGECSCKIGNEKETYEPLVYDTRGEDDHA